MLLTCCPVSAQSISDTAAARADTHRDSARNVRVLKQIAGSYSVMRTDDLENIYLVTARSGQLKKLNIAGDSVAVYNNVKQYGSPQALDVSNPLQVLVFYPAFNTVEVLDRLLSLQGKINLRDLGIFNASAVASSYDSNIWVFDAQNMKLKKVSFDGKVLMETNDLRNFMEVLPEPAAIIDDGRNVFLYDPEKGFFSFDHFGSFRKQWPVPGWENAGVFKTVLYGFADGSLQTLDMATAQSNRFPLTERLGDMLSAEIVNGKLFVLQKTGVKVYRAF